MASRISDLIAEVVSHHDHDNQQNTPTDVNDAHSHSLSNGSLLKPSQSAQARLAHFRTPPSTPSMRTGPPRTLSFVYSHPNSPATSRRNSQVQNGDILESDAPRDEEEFPFGSNEFRGALEVSGSVSSEKKDKGKKRESRFLDETWNPMKWFHESPKDEKSGFEFGEPEGERNDEGVSQQDELRDDPEDADGPKRANSESQTTTPNDKPKAARIKWKRLRSLLPNVVAQQTTPGPSAVVPHAVNITDELITGGLSTLMLRLWFERDEKDHRRIPILLHRLRIRISDSLHPMHDRKSVFRIECEYANGAARWVIYRQLRDFLSLHTHYAVSNAYNRNVDDLPEFPRTSKSPDC